MLFWLLIGIVLIFIEILSMSFFIVFFGFGALSVAISLLFHTLSWPQQIILFTLLSLLYFVVGKNLFKGRGKESDLDKDLIGQTVLVEKEIHPNEPGKVLLRDTLWQASSKVHLQKGQRARIISISNITLEVLPL